jgi:hypothetical protein
MSGDLLVDGLAQSLKVLVPDEDLDRLVGFLPEADEFDFAA